MSYEERRRRGYQEWRKQGYGQWRKRVAEARRAYWEVQRPVNEARREATRAAAAAQIGTLTDRELLIAGAVAYWCEGTKNKPGHRYDRVVFMNSDPGPKTIRTNVGDDHHGCLRVEVRMGSAFYRQIERLGPRGHGGQPARE